LEDAAIQATIAFYLGERIEGSAHDPETVSDLVIDLKALMASIVQGLVKVGGLDIDRLGCGELRMLCDRYAPEGSAGA
jgi:hypothetical protein